MANRWSKRAAIRRMNQNQKLREIIAIEPRILPILKEAATQHTSLGYNRIHTYYELRNQVIPLVGWESKNRDIGSTAHYETVINVISDLLPPDDVDLYPNILPDEDDEDDEDDDEEEDEL